MALDLHISGPELDVHRRLEPGEPAMVLGRDTDCAICLPDPERNVSRRHLSVWNEGDVLHFHVLSAVNGVDIASGELPPGSRGVLPPGEVMGLWAYRLVVTPVLPVAAATGAAPADADPWAEFERQAAQLVPEAGSETMPANPDGDDPFGDWGFQSTFGPGAPGGGLDADSLQPAADLGPFLRGLGVAGLGAFTQGELETMGRLTRIALQGLLQASQAAAEARHEGRSEDRTLAEARELNPLRMDSSIDSKLAYLFGGQAAAGALLPADRAVAQLVSELGAHQQAMGDAVHEAVRSILEEFDPEALKKRLLGGGARIFESARAWDAFSRDYAERHVAADEWVRQLLDRHFARAYARALVRAKRETPGRKGG
jgi:predicted component of type VI protein secretion system